MPVFSLLFFFFNITLLFCIVFFSLLDSRRSLFSFSVCVLQGLRSFPWQLIIHAHKRHAGSARIEQSCFLPLPNTLDRSCDLLFASNQKPPLRDFLCCVEALNSRRMGNCLSCTVGGGAWSLWSRTPNR